MDAEPEPIPDHHDDMSVLGGGDGSFLGDDLEGFNLLILTI
jgi:hypothetical protein